MRLLIISMLSFISIKIDSLFRLDAAFPVVPDPHIGSRTISPSFDEMAMILSRSLIGFAVGYVLNSEP